MRVAAKTLSIPPGRFHFKSPLHTIFERIARKQPHRSAVSFGEETLTYGELNEKSNVLAHWLISLGVGAEHRVGVCLSPGIGIIIALLAILKAGGTYLPIDPDYPKERIKSIIEDAGLDLTISQKDIIEKLADILPHPCSYPLNEPIFKECSIKNPEIDIPEQTTACIFYTSGTTGRPKGIAISHKSLSFYILSAIDQFGINPADKVLTIAKFSFSISLFDLLASVISGAKLTILPRIIIMDFISLTTALQQATVAHLGPALLKGVVHYIKNNFADFHLFDDIRHISSGGDIVPAELLEDLKAIFSNAEIYVMYGCTEIACMGCFYSAPRDSVVDRSYIGKPFPGNQCILLEENGELTRSGGAGEICFKGPGVMKGYINKPELTEKAFAEIDKSMFFRTGDLGRFHPSGDLEYLGRRDFQIKIRGQRIELLDIESHLRRAPGIRDAVISTTQIDAGDIRLIAYITIEENIQFSLDQVRVHLRQHLPDYMQPSRWMILDKIPLNENLKIARKALPVPTPDMVLHSEIYNEPRTQEERLLARIWQDIIGIDRVGINDNFFDIGGDSLMVMTVCMLAAENGMMISPSQLWSSPTIEKLVEAGIRHCPDHEENPPCGPCPRTLPCLPPFMHRFFDAAGSRTPNQWNISRMLVARRRLSADLLESSLSLLGTRHDAFRLRFARTGDRWQASIQPTAEATLAFRTVDLSHLPEDQQAKAMAACAKEWQEAISLTRGPIAWMALFEMGEDQPQHLFFIVHHFAMDVISWRNFWLEFDSVYQRFESGGDHSIPIASASFAEWTNLLQPYADSKEVEANVNKWVQQDWSEIHGLPKDLSREREANTNASAQVVQFAMTVEETQWLLRSRVHGLNAERILISGLAAALGRWQDSRAVYFDRLLHGRNVAPPEMDLSGTIGCMVSYAPTLIKIDRRKSPETFLLDVAKQIDNLSGNHINLYKYFGSNPALVRLLTALPQPEVLFNYRGPVDDVIETSALFKRTYTIAGLDHDPRELRLYPLAIVIDIIRNRLEARFVYSASVHKRESIDVLSADIQNYVRSIIDLHSSQEGRLGLAPSRRSFEPE